MIVGTAGHIDHGKTALVRVLTGVDTDRLKEEKARGISIDLGFAYLAAPDGGVIGFVDVPGHERFVHTMLAGATAIDMVLLAVAADDGVMPQTREHLAIIDLLGLTRGVVAITKADLVDDARMTQVRYDITAALAGTGLANARHIAVSAPRGEGVDALRDLLFAQSGIVARGRDEGRFRLAVDRSFTLAGTGTVVTGAVLSGRVAVGDQVVVSPSGLTARVRSIHAQNRPAHQGVAGERCALNLAGEGITKDAIHRGDVILDPALHAPTGRIDARMRLLSGEAKPVAQWMPVRLHHAATEVGARIVLLDEDPIAPGGTGLVQLVLERPIAAAEGDRFILRDTTGQRTIGGGAFLDLRAPSRRRRTPERQAQLFGHAIEAPNASLAARLERAPGYVDLALFARDRALSEESLARIMKQLHVIALSTSAGPLGFLPATWDALLHGLIRMLADFHAVHPDFPGIGFEKLRLATLPRLPAPAFLALLRGLAKDRRVLLDGAWVRLPGHEVRLTPGDEALWRKIKPMLAGQERFRPPRVRDLSGVLDAPEESIRRLMKILGRLGKVDEIAHDHFFLRDTTAEMVAIACDVAAGAIKGEFIAAQFRDRLDNGRKVAIQILDFFDRHGVTLRRGDLRRINRHRLDLFRALEEPDAANETGREPSPVGRPDFKSGKGREPVLGGFDSLSLPPTGRSH